jgi:hypothetical protein
VADSFDPYYQWLAIPPKDQPPNRYRLLGIELFEDNLAVIENAANQRMAHVRTFQIGPNAAWSQKILNELAAARVCLLNPEKKAEYDRSLRQELTLQNAANHPYPGEIPAGAVPVAGPIPPAPPSAFAVALPEAVSDRVRHRRTLSWQAVTTVAGVFAACGILLAVLLTRGGQQEHFPIAEGPLRPAHEEPIQAQPQAAEPAGGQTEAGEAVEDSAPAAPSQPELETSAAIPPVAAPVDVVPEIEKTSVVAPSPEFERDPADDDSNRIVQPPMVARGSPAVLPMSAADESASEPTEREKLEAAAALGLKWIAAHQREDGSWSFQTGPNPGRFKHAIGGTSMALLPLLRFGSTHRAGQYQENVSRGLEYILTRAQTTPSGLDLRGGELEYGMYVQAVSTIVLCQAYLQSKDRELRNPAQLAVNFIVDAQDPKGGGWRYTPRQPGDTSVLGWQITALVCAREAKLKVPQLTLARAAAFLDSVQSENGRAYGYQRPGHGSSATTAIGLLCRTWLGWDRDTPALQDGVRSIAAEGPSNDVYHNFYATRLLALWGQADPKSADEQPEWKTWKEQMRTRILDSQSRFGDAEGSWLTGRGFVNEQAGRLGVTSLTLLILAAVAPDE